MDYLNCELVSIIIPSYNCASYLADSISSSLSQTHKNIEIIVIDDGSIDNTFKIVTNFKMDPRVKYIYQENKGLPSARNAGIMAATGEYILFLDADDEISPLMAAECLEHIKNESADFCITDILRIENINGVLVKEERRSNIPKDNFEFAILKENFIRGLPFYRKQSLIDVGLFDDEMLNIEDWDLNIRMICAGKHFCYLPKPYYFYKIRKGSITKSNKKNLYKYMEIIYRKHHKYIADSGNNEVAKIYADHIWNLARIYLVDTHQIVKGVTCLVESLKYDFNYKKIVSPFLTYGNKLRSKV